MSFSVETLTSYQGSTGTVKPLVVLAPPLRETILVSVKGHNLFRMSTISIASVNH
jgi:hypothetical protein